MKQERYKQIVAIYVFLMKGESVFLMRRANTGYMDGHYSVITGSVEQGESVKSAAVREAKEETGITIDLHDLTFVHVVHRKVQDERVGFYFTIHKWKGEPFNAEPEKCDDVGWFNVDKLPKNTSPYILRALANFTKGVVYDEFGWSD